MRDTDTEGIVWCMNSGLRNVTKESMKRANARKEFLRLGKIRKRGDKKVYVMDCETQGKRTFLIGRGSVGVGGSVVIVSGFCEDHTQHCRATL